jgi:hypothetical protein
LGAESGHANSPRGFATSVVNGKVFAIGGDVDKFGERSIATVEMYDPETDTVEVVYRICC